jgi:hypothetical protein
LNIFCKEHNLFATPKEIKKFIRTEIEELIDDLPKEKIILNYRKQYRIIYVPYQKAL